MSSLFHLEVLNQSEEDIPFWFKVGAESTREIRNLFVSEDVYDIFP